MINIIQNTVSALKSILGIIRKGLELSIPFTESGKDFSPNGNDATLKTGKALSFDGLNDSVVIGDTSYNANTISITFKNESDITSATAQQFLMNIEGAGYYGLVLGSFTGTLTDELITVVDSSGNKNSFESSTEVISAGVHRIVIVYNSSNSYYDIYLDAVKLNLTTIDTMSVIPADNVILGRRADVSGFFNGLLSDFQIYDTAWTAADVSYDYNNPQNLVTDNSASSIALSNLKGFWHLSEGEGAIAYDSSGEANNGAINGATWETALATIPQLGMMDWAKSTVGSDEITLIQAPNNEGYDILGNALRLRENALNLDGSGYAEVADDDSLDFGTGDFTLEAWVKNSSVISDDDRSGLLSKSDTSGGSPNGWQLIYRGGSYNGVFLRAKATGGNVEVSPSSNQTSLLSDGDWHHLVCVIDVSNTKGYIYIDNSEVTQGGGASIAGILSQDNSESVLIGKWADSVDDNLNGIIDETRIYNRALSASEITQNYKAGKNKHKN